MFNSPARPIKGTPRRGVSRAPRTPSVLADRDREAIPPPSTARTNRLAHIRREDSPTTSVAETIRTTREVEGYDKVSWSRDDRRAVSSLGSLPKEVNGIIKSLDGSPQLVRGVVDISSGYAMISTSTGCKAWNYVKRTNASPTCYSFPTGSSSSSYSQSSAPVLAGFFSGSGFEPGVVSVSPDGEIRAWENMSLGLGNMDRFQEAYLEMAQDDVVDNLWKLDGTNFVVSTRQSFLFRLTISVSAGRAAPVVAPFTVSRGMFSRATSVIFGNDDDKHGIVSIASSGSTAYILAWRTMQKWTISQDSQKLVQEYDVIDTVGESVFGDEWKQSQILLEVNDIAFTDDNQLAALIEYTENQSASSSTANQARSYGVALLDLGGRSGSISVGRFIDLAYSPSFDALSSPPRIMLPAGSPVAYIQFSAAVVLLSFSPNLSYQDVIGLKLPNAFLGSGSRQTPKKLPNQASLVLIPAFGGLVSVEAFGISSRVEAESLGETGTSKLRSQLEQAVFFGDRLDNPLSFMLDPDIEGDLGEAMQQVSDEIASHSSQYMPALYELKAQLADRADRLRRLMTFVVKNGLLERVPQSCRRSLQRNAEKVQAAIELWDHQDRLMDKLNTRSPQSLLSDSIRAYMSALHTADSEDVIRLFFRTQVQNLDKLLEVVFATFQAATADQRTERSDWTIEANTVFLRVLRESARLREDDEGIYQIERKQPAIELWTSQDSLLNNVEALFAATERLIQDRTRELGSVIDERPVEGTDESLYQEQVRQDRLKDQMMYLGASLCSNMEDRVRFASRKQLDGDGDVQDGLALGARWVALRPRTIRPLVAIDRIANAYNLAEHHQDWETLVWLCHHSVAGRGAAEVQRYIEAYGEEFAFVLYQWYIDNNHRHALLGQDKVYAGLVSRFFETRSYPELSWMHHLACRRYGDAAADLLAVDRAEARLSDKELLGSIGKLAAVVERKSLGPQTKRKDLLEDLDDELDDIKIQKDLQDSLIGNISSRRGARPSMSEYAETQILALESRPVLKELFSDLAQRLVDGFALDTEGLVDVLTLKGNTAVSSRDPVIALEKLYRDTNLPAGRRQVVLLSIWRRVYIRDDWEEIANTSGRSDEAQRQLLRHTLAYQTFSHLAYSKSFSADYELDPEEAGQPPLAIELSARFPDWRAEDIDALMRDHEDEIAQLARWRGADLERMIREVKELVRRDVADITEGEDISM